MLVNKEIFYHSNSGNKLSVGDVLIFNSNTHNRMHDEVYNSQHLLNGIDANELLNNKKKDKKLNISDDEFELIFKTINSDAFVMRELALEEVRKNKCPDYPSRLNCLYVTKNKEDALEWSDILKRNKKKCNQVLTLECTGELFIGDGDLIKRQNLSYQKHLENAEKYWSGKTSKTPEYLFYGTARIIAIDELNTSNHILERR